MSAPSREQPIVCMPDPLTSLESLAKLWTGETLATLRSEALREFNGTAFKALRPDGKQRLFILCCVTGEHELGKVTDHFLKVESEPLGQWSKVSLMEAVSRAIMAGGFIHDFDSESSAKLKPLVLIAAGPDSVKKLEALLMIS